MFSFNFDGDWTRREMNFAQIINQYRIRNNPPPEEPEEEMVIDQITADQTGTDHVSTMPDEVLLHIMSLIPITEASSMTFLSRRWRHLPRQLHVLDFDIRSVRLENFVNQTLDRHTPTVDVQKFRINLNWDGPWCVKNHIHPQVDEWIGKAMAYNVKELDLTLWKCSYDLYDVIYELPWCVFNCQSLTMLRLSHCKLKSIGVLNLVSLKTLYLKEVFVESDIMQRLLASCVALEMLCLYHCLELEALVGQFMNLKYLEIVSCHDIQTFNIDVPSLQSFKFLTKFPDVEMITCGANSLKMPGFNLDFSGLVTLALTAELTNDIIQLLMAKCRLLENFTLKCCTKLKELTICSHNLKRLELIHCADLNKVEIDAPSLRYFGYIGKEVVELSRMNTNCMLVAKLEFAVDWRNEDIQYDKLKGFLERFNHVKAVHLVSREAAERVLIPEEMLQNTLPPLYHLKDLKLKASSTKKSYKQVLVGLLSLSVHLEMLSINLGSLVIKLKFQPEMSTDLDDFPNLDWSFLPVDHVQRRLIEVEIRNMRGDRMEKELVEFLCRNPAISGGTYTPLLKNWSWKA